MADIVETAVEKTAPETPAPKKGGGKFKYRATVAIALCLAAVLGVCALSNRPPEAGAGSASSGIAEDVPDTVGPQLLGVQDLTVAMGGTVSYRDGVSAVDDVDGSVPFQVDAEAVDLSVPGEYPVIYSAQDGAGNRTELAITVTVIETLTVDQDVEEPDEEEPPAGSGGGGTAIPLEQITQEDVDRLADQILAQITNSGMSQREKAKAIFDYVNKHVRYIGTSDKSSWIIGAYVGFTRGRGDCYNYFACSKALLTRVGIPNVDLRRVGGTSLHYWQLVNTGDGWYHFDACPHPNGYPLYSFMITETQARAYTEQASASRKNYYVYDYAACPVRVVGMPEEEPVPPVEENPDSSQLPENPDSSQLPENPDGSQLPENPDGSQLPENPDSSQLPENPDSSQLPENPDGSQLPENPDSSQLPENPDSSQLPENPDGSQLPENPDSSQLPENPDASQLPENPDSAQLPENPNGPPPPAEQMTEGEN